MPYSSLFSNSHGINDTVEFYLKQANFQQNIQVLNLFDLQQFGVDQTINALRSMNYDSLFLQCSHHSYNHFYKNFLELYNQCDRVVAITGNGKYLNSAHENLHYFPYYWYNSIPGPQREEFIEPWLLRTDLIAGSKKYPVSCLNNRFSWHRLILFSELYVRDYFARIMFSMNELIHEDDLITDSPEYNYIVNIKQKYPGILPIHLDRHDSGWSTELLGMNHDAYTNSYLNIVTENSWDEAFLSEKSFKPIASGQLFLILSGVGTISLLRDLGFDVFDDYFDHGYDQEPDLESRVKMLMLNVDRWFSMDHAKVWSDTQPRRLSNAEKFFQLDVSVNPFEAFFH